MRKEKAKKRPTQRGVEDSYPGGALYRAAVSIAQLWLNSFNWFRHILRCFVNSSNYKPKPFVTADEGEIMNDNPEKDRYQGGNALKVNVRIPDRHKGEKLPPARVYLFDKAGQLVATERVDEDYDRATEIKVPLDRNYRVIVGPDLLGGKEKRPADLATQLTKVRAISGFPRRNHTRDQYFCLSEYLVVLVGDLHSRSWYGAQADQPRKSKSAVCTDLSWDGPNLRGRSRMHPPQSGLV
jgi:hypothetical protein